MRYSPISATGSWPARLACMVFVGLLVCALPLAAGAQQRPEARQPDLHLFEEAFESDPKLTLRLLANGDFAPLFQYDGRVVFKRTFKVRAYAHDGPKIHLYRVKGDDQRRSLGPDSSRYPVLVNHERLQEVQLSVFFVARDEDRQHVETCDANVEWQRYGIDYRQWLLKLGPLGRGTCRDGAAWKVLPRYEPKLSELPYAIVCRGECPKDAWLDALEVRLRDSGAFGGGPPARAVASTDKPAAQRQDQPPGTPQAKDNAATPRLVQSGLSFYRPDLKKPGKILPPQGLEAKVVTPDCSEYLDGRFGSPDSVSFEPAPSKETGLVCVVLKMPGRSEPRCIVHPYYADHNLLPSIAWPGFESLNACPRSRPIEVTLLKEDGRPFNMQRLKELEGAMPGKGQWTSTGLSIERDTGIDIGTIPFQEIFRYHKATAPAVKSNVLVEARLRPQYVELANLSFKFQNESGGLEGGCDARLVVPERRQLGDGWQRLKNDTRLFDADGSIILYHGQKRDAPSEHKGSVLVSTIESDGEVRLRFNDPKCHSNEPAISTQEMLNQERPDRKPIERTTRPARTSLVAILSADSRLGETVTNRVLHQRLWNEIVKLLDDIAQKGPKPGDQWEKTAVIRHLAGDPVQTIKPGNAPLFQNESERDYEAERLWSASSSAEKNAQPFKWRLLSSSLEEVHTSMGFKKGSASPTVLLTFGELVQKTADSLCFGHDGFLNPRRDELKGHKIVAIELVASGNLETFRGDLDEAKALPGSGVFDCKVNPAFSQTFRHFMLQVPTVLQAATLPDVFKYLREQVRDFIAK